MDRSRQRLVAAGITAAAIQEPGAADPRMNPAPSYADDLLALAREPRQPLALHLAIPPGNRAGTTPRPPPFPQGEGVRQFPLPGFHQGGASRGRNKPPGPRVRGDHVLILLGQGALTIEFPRHRLPLPAGHAAFIPAGTAFALQAGHDIKGRVLLITPGFGCGSPMPLPPGFRSGAVAAEDLPPIEPVILTPGTAQARPTTCGTDLTRQVALIARVLSRLDAPPCRSADTATCTVDSRLLTERFLELAQAELAEPQTIADMARKLGHSLARLDQACWQSRGRSALQLLYDLRLAQAAEALRRTTRPINEIALDLGYSGPGHFIRSFSAATGRSPQAYREFTRDGLQVAGSEAAQLQPETAPRCTDP